MARLKRESFRPVRENCKVYDQLYAEYCGLYDYFGRGTNDAMKRLKALRQTQRRSAKRSA